MIHDVRIAAAAGSKTTGHHRTLRQSVHLAIHSFEARQQQHAALQILRVTDSSSAYVDMHARLRESRQRCRYHYGGRVFDKQLAGIHRDAHLLQCVRKTLG